MKVLVIHHDDADGRVGGFIMHSYYTSKGYDVECFEANYDTEFVFSKLVVVFILFLLIKIKVKIGATFFFQAGALGTTLQKQL